MKQKIDRLPSAGLIVMMLFLAACTPGPTTIPQTAPAALTGDSHTPVLIDTDMSLEMI